MTEIDKTIALWLGYTFETFPNGACPLTEHWRKPDGTINGFRPPPFSSDVGRAWEVVERMRALGHYLNIHQRAEVCWCSVEDYGGQEDEAFRVKAETAPLAICRAAIKAMREGK